MKQIEKITIQELKEIASKMFGNLVKTVVDINTEKVVVDADLHSDEEQYLLNQGSKQSDLWGINIYPDLPKENRIEFDSMINIRPRDNNNSRSVEDITIQKRIAQILDSLITE
jgi:hypothetical protein